jgi:hypothetical protein
MVMARQLATMSFTRMSQLRSSMIVHIPVELVTEGSICVGKNHVDVDIKSSMAMS